MKKVLLFVSLLFCLYVQGQDGFLPNDEPKKTAALSKFVEQSLPETSPSCETPTLPGTAEVSPATICSGATVTFTLSGNRGKIVRWEHQTAPGDPWTDYGYQDRASWSLVLSNTPGPGNYTPSYRALVQKEGCDPAYSNAVTVTVKPAAFGGYVSLDKTAICSGDPLRVTLSSSKGNQIQWWYKIATGEDQIPGAAGTDFTQTWTVNPPAVPAGPITIRALVWYGQFGECPADWSGEATFTLDKPPYGGTATVAKTTICSGDENTFTLSENEGAIVNWQQQETDGSWTDIPNSANTVFITHLFFLNPTNVPNTTNYRAKVKNGNCPPGFSKAVTVTLYPRPNASTNFHYEKTVYCANEGTATAIFGEGGTLGGIYSCDNCDDPDDLKIDPHTGNINLTLSKGRTLPYRVLYTIPATPGCPAFITATAISIINATIKYPNSPYCSNLGTINVDFTGTAGGTFTCDNCSTPGDLKLDPNTGAVGLGDSKPGSYIVKYKLSSCPDLNIVTGIVIKQAPTFNLQTVKSEYCNGDEGFPINFNVSPSGTPFTWSNSSSNVGFGQQGTTDIDNFTATNNTTVLKDAGLQATATLNGCTGTSGVKKIYVTSTPHVESASPTSFCNEEVSGGIHFTSDVNNTTYTWTMPGGPGIGTVSENGSTSVQFVHSTPHNDTKAPVTRMLTVHPYVSQTGYITCPGPARDFTITVNPTPHVLRIPSINPAYCYGEMIADIPLHSDVSGATFKWESYGDEFLSSGEGPVIPGRMANFDMGNRAFLLVGLDVKATANGCTGPGTAPVFYDIKINAKPKVKPIANVNYAGGAAGGPIHFEHFLDLMQGGTVVFNWSVDKNVIGIGPSNANYQILTSGAGDIPAFWAINNTDQPITATVTVTASTLSPLCTGPAETFKITVNPALKVSVLDAEALPGGVDPNTVYIGYAPASAITLVSQVSGNSTAVKYQWSTGASTPGIRVSPVVNTTYSVTVTDTKGNTSTASKTIKVVDISCGNNKVTVCEIKKNKQQTKCKNVNTVAKDLADGSYLGECKASASFVENASTVAGSTANAKGLEWTAEPATPGLRLVAVPNPSSGYFRLNIVSGSEDKISLRISDATGRLVEQRTVGVKGTLQLGDTWHPGLYYAEAVQGKERVTVKLIKQ